MEFILTSYTQPKVVNFGTFSKFDLLSDHYTTSWEFEQRTEFLKLACLKPFPNLESSLL